MVDAWGGSWGTSWAETWIARAAQQVEASTGGGWVDEEGAKQRSKRQHRADKRERERLEELRRAYNAANGIIEEAPAEATEAVRRAVAGHSRASEAQPLPVVNWEALARDTAAMQALERALAAFAHERRLEEEAVEMLLMSI